jgi:hypothetical protein
MSERALDPNLKATAESADFRYVVFVDLAFPSGNVRLHNSVGTFSFGGNEYYGVGGFGTIEAMVDSVQLVDNPVKLVLSSITPEIIDAIKTDDIYKRDADVYLCALDADGQLDGIPDNWINGFMETAELNIGKENAVVINIQTRASKLRKRNNKRFTIEEHQREFSGDLFFEFLPYLIDAEVQWGGGKIGGGGASSPNESDGLGVETYEDK